jgi:S-DNA-T family DNA segregation ATPase FtsK/SpoIIIE
MSLDRKLDLTGIVLLFVGLLTLLMLFSSNNSSTVGSWLSLLGRTFGWGAYLFPVALFGVGLWLVLRKIESIPQISVERVLGVILLFALLLTAFHFFIFPETGDEAGDFARKGFGGGYIGAAFLTLLRDNLGWGGAAIALLAWLIIALALTLDRPVVELFSWISPLFMRMQDSVGDYLDERREKQGGRSIWPFRRVGSEPTTDGSLSGMSIQTSTSLGMSPMQPLPFQPTQVPRSWVLPPIDEILDTGGDVKYDDDYDRQRARTIEETLSSFGAPVNVVEINRGPTITQFGVEPDYIETRKGRTRVRVGKIASLVDDLALALSARTIRVQAPVPGKGYVGIEVPNDEITLVALRDVVESEAFTRLDSPIRFALGQDVAGNAVAVDLAAMPHLLIAGATGSGKSVCVNSMINCLLLHNTPDNLRLIMVDPKRVELTGYNGIPHLLAPVVVELERVVGALQWVLREMDLRYQKLAGAGARNILEYNTQLETEGKKKLPRLVVIIDELADLMMLAPDETERTITRLAQLARATGIHLVIATQRPSVDVVTGLIKANFPARVAFAVASGVDSRVVLDQPGAERLLGRGDMLFQSPDAVAPLRLQGTFVSEDEIQRLVYYWRSLAGNVTPTGAPISSVVDSLPSGIPLKQMPLWEEMTSAENADPLLNESIDLCRRQGRASISMLQRRLRIGYTRAARLIETMQDNKLIGTEAGPLGFEILDYGPAAPPIEER